MAEEVARDTLGRHRPRHAAGMKASTAIWWIRRDLRLHDNAALHAALAGSQSVVPVFVLDERLLRSPNASPRRNAFLFGGLAALDASLRERGSRLIIRRGRPLEILSSLAGKIGADAVHAELDHTPYARRRDAELAAALPLQWVTGVTVHPPELIVRPDGSPYAVYGAFRRAWKALPLPDRQGLLPVPRSLPEIPDVESESLPDRMPIDDFPPGEVEAFRRLERFTNEFLPDYTEGRDALEPVRSSGLSPYLRFGMLSARTAVARAVEVGRAADERTRQSAESWLDELIWREFYIAVLAHHPEVLQGAFRPALRGIRWQNREDHFAAWTDGRTGYPVVDAAMRQLLQTGWMPNRARMIVASFLTKDLLIDWRWGERWFMQNLIDGDPAANNGGWQWTAGVGTDAAPYFRIFNPTLQGRKFDPTGAYVHRWVPELRALPAATIHEPWRTAAKDLQAVGIVIGRDYPAPIVDHSLQRAHVLAAYRAAQAEAAERRPPSRARRR